MLEESLDNSSGESKSVSPKKLSKEAQVSQIYRVRVRVRCITHSLTNLEKMTMVGMELVRCQMH